jgi:hypothetical protein
LKADAAVEPDEAVKVVLLATGATGMSDPVARVVIADDDTEITTVVAGAGLQSPVWNSKAGPPALLAHQGRLVWNGPAEGRVFSFAEGELAPRTEAAAFAIPAQMVTAGPWLVRLEIENGIAPDGCTGPGAVGRLVRSGLDGSEGLVLARPSLCGIDVPPVMTAEAVFYVEAQASPNQYHLRRVSINGGAPQTLLTLNWPPRSLLVAGPWLWCVDDRLTEGVLWRVAVDGSGGQEWLTGLCSPAGQLVRDEEFLYLADTSHGGAERIHRISPVERTKRVVWQANVSSGERAIRSLALAEGQLVWLDQRALQTMPCSGGAVRTLVDGIAFPGSVSVGPSGIAWSQREQSGQIRMYDPRTGLVTTRVESVPYPGTLIFVGETLMFAAGAGGYDGRMFAVNHDGTQLRLLAASGGRPAALQTDASDVFWIDNQLQLRSVPKAGGEVTDILAGVGLIASFLLDGDTVYAALPEAGLLVRAAKTGGPVTTLTGIAPRSSILLAQTAATVVYTDGYFILAVPKSGGRPKFVAQLLTERPSAMATDGVRVYWLEPLADRIRAAALPQ